MNGRSFLLTRCAATTATPLGSRKLSCPSFSGRPIVIQKLHTGRPLVRPTGDAPFTRRRNNEKFQGLHARFRVHARKRTRNPLRLPLRAVKAEQRFRCPAVPCLDFVLVFHLYRLVVRFAAHNVDYVNPLRARLIPNIHHFEPNEK